MAGVRLERLSKSYDGTIAVRELDLDIGDGELLVLVGPSGCGKTTTLRMVAGLEPATGGRILIGEMDVTGLPPRDRDIAMVFQNYALYPHMTVRQNLAFGLRMRKTPRPEMRRRIDEVAAKLGLEPLLERKPAALSGGQRQRVALGRAMVRDPAVFLFDEPLSNLDAKLRVHTRAELVRLHGELGTTMIYVTHDQTEAMTMGQRIAVLNQGELQQCAPPLEVYDQPANLFVAGFIGSPPMNLFPGSLLAETGGLQYRGASFALATPWLRPPSGAGARDVVLGVRPEHLEVTAGPSAEHAGAEHAGAGASSAEPDSGNARVQGEDAGDGAPGSIARTRATVQVLEALGSETLIYCRTAAGEDVIARRQERSRLGVGDNVELTVRAAHAHVFDAGSGTRLANLRIGD